MSKPPPKRKRVCIVEDDVKMSPEELQMFEELKLEKAKADSLAKTLVKLDNYTLLEIDLHTGRHHQIRAQLEFQNC